MVEYSSPTTGRNNANFENVSGLASTSMLMIASMIGAREKCIVFIALFMDNAYLMIGGNKYRLLANIDFEEQIFNVRAVLTHERHNRK